MESLDPVTSGPLTDAGATSYRAVRRALPRIYPGGAVTVIDVGGLGSFAVQFLRLLTAALLATTSSASPSTTSKPPTLASPPAPSTAPAP